MLAMLVPMVLTLIGGVMILAAFYDAATLTIPNWLSAILIVLFPFAAIDAGLTLSDAGLHLVIGFAALLVGMFMFAMNWIGGGDAKFFAAVSLYMGLASVVPYLFAVVVAGGALSAILLGARWVQRFGIPMDWFLKFTRGGSVIPYGIAIAAGGLFVLPKTQIFIAALA